MIQHKSLSTGRWAELSFCEQMANIGSEISRALNWRNKGKAEMSLKAAVRALELIDLTLATAQTYPQLREVARTREVVVDDFFESNTFSSTEESWRKYFDHFAGWVHQKKNQNG